MQFETWIKNNGAKSIAKKLDVDPSSVSQWLNRKAFPRPETLYKIHKASKGRVTYAAMVHHYLGRWDS